MVQIVTGDIFNMDADAFVCPTNTDGIMGKGLALAFKQGRPRMAAEYTRYAKSNTLEPGDLWTCQYQPEVYICIATKKQYWRPSQIEWIRRGLVNLEKWCNANPNKSVALPALGCGLGGLDWEVVRPLCLEVLGDVANTVYLIKPRESGG